ncbi:MAG: N-acetyltransferase [Planctomycetaceae bacterium]|nr:N-acetyltransferase [Planctomycetaceae bacterium]
MSDISIVPVQTKRQQKQFLTLPWKIYRDDPYWIPPLRQNQKELVGFAPHPFYDDSEGQAFLALRNGEPVGRVLAIVNTPHIERFKERRGFFGFFESVDDQEVATGLFDAAKRWLAERDILDIRGPMNPSMNYEVGLLIEGFDSSPQFMMTYNPPYYAKLIEGCGFRKTQDMYAFWGHSEMLESLDKKLYFVVDEATKRFGVTLRQMDPKNFIRDVRMFLSIYNSSLGGTWGFTPLSEGEIDHMADSMKHLIVPELTSIAEVDGRPVATAFALLDYNPRIKKIDGRLFPFGFMRLFWRRRAIKNIRIISTNVIPEYQKWGLGLVILSRLVPEVISWGVKEAEFSWVLESNQLSYKTLKRGGAKLTKTYRVYDCGPNSEWPDDA